MAQFKCDIIDGPNGTHWTLSGDINEHAVLPAVKQNKDITINLKNVTMLNSYGVKIWCQWMKNNVAIPSILLEECPYVVIQNLGMVQGFINDNTTVTSFFVPFINESGTEVQQVLFTLGKDYKNDGFIGMPVVKDSTGESMELDVSPSTYFSFLKKQNQKSKKS